MIRQLVDFKESSPVILIEDSLEQNGSGILKVFIISLLKRYTLVHLVVYENNEDKFMNGMPPNMKQRLILHNFATDPLAWENSGSLHMGVDLYKHITGQLVSKQEDSKTAVVIDSISNLILYRSAAYTCQVLHQLAFRRNQSGAEVEQVVSLVHRDLHDSSALSTLHHTSTSIITVYPPVTNDCSMICDTLHKKASGKVSRFKQELSINKDFEISEVNEVIYRLPTKETATEGAGLDPAANLTFNLNLSDKEKDDRQKLNLPYIHDKQRQEASLENSAGAGKIFYQPDEADDFDEEDPDDDLDI